MTKTTTNLEQHVQKLVLAQGSSSPVTLSTIAGIRGIQAHITYEPSRPIQLNIPADWNPEQYQRIANFTKKQRIKNTRIKVVEDVGFHEMGHHKLKNDRDGLGCPQDLEGKEVAVDAVSKAMLEAGKFSQDGALYLENMISDIIDHTNCAQYTKLNGMAIYFAEQGELNGETFSPLFEAFVKLNLRLSGRKEQNTLLKAYYANAKTDTNTTTKKVDEIVEACVKEVHLTTDRTRNRQMLFDKTQWPRIFYGFARHLVELMDQDAPEVLPQIGIAGKGYKVPVVFGKEARFDPEDADDPMFKRVLDNDNLKKIMMRRNKEGREAPCFLEKWRSLDYLYQALASEIIIKAETPKRGERMPIAPVQARTFDSDKDDVKDILFGRILLDENGQPTFAVPRAYIEHTARYKQSVTSYPELNIAVLDNSTSMEEAAKFGGSVGNKSILPWGDQSKYHYGVLSYYGVEKALHRMGVGTRTKYNLITFAHKTEATGEKAYEDRGEIKRRILNPTFGSDTRIDVGLLAKQAAQPGSVLMTMSDGAIGNWNEWYSRPEYDSSKTIQVRNGALGTAGVEDGIYVLASDLDHALVVERGNVVSGSIENGTYQKQVRAGVKVKEKFRQIISDKYYVHFQLGEDTETTRDLESWGASVVKISDASQMPRKAIDITQKFYKSYAAGEMQ